MANYKIKETSNTIHAKSFYWVAPNGYIIAVTKGRESLLSDQELKQVLTERIEEYKDAQGLSNNDLQ